MSQASRPPMRPRSKSGWSFHSDKSGNSSKRPTIDLRESHAEKAKQHLSETTKANPNAAINELQPNVEALTRSTMTSLSSVAHMDVNGNPITDPDRSNPTRSRWERPLDTIRSFEEQIDIAYKRRNSGAVRNSTMPETPGGYASRRSSYVGGHDNSYQQPSNRSAQMGGYYGRSRDSYGPRESYYRRESYQPNDYGPPVPQHRSSRTPVDPYANRYTPPSGAPVYPNQGSRDTFGTGESSGSQSDPWTNSTDPSSENSSLDRHPAAPVKPPGTDVAEQYGFNGFGGNPILEENGGFASNPYSAPPRPHANGSAYYNRGPPRDVPPPPPPPHADKVGPLKNTSGNAPPSVRGKLQRAPSSGEKRVSWLKKRFSKG